jgi:hypothetical protein
MYTSVSYIPIGCLIQKFNKLTVGIEGGFQFWIFKYKILGTRCVSYINSFYKFLGENVILFF